MEYFKVPVLASMLSILFWILQTRFYMRLFHAIVRLKNHKVTSFKGQ